ncbi:TQXA domain-containing protein [Auritidibacter sp. NML130574]|uniref:Cys-Gln thioester bond-forming surface protein n=1 Tax=Auritidibacter sp. NML130574 TaxID=2170745 RepID=UPI000E35FA45|nr:Cys-Gln thioester bond-forming surface protein [Auritidibacter sp. NML130574]AXR74218.1 TQXA domain-containing protein [Auritidibacter sp. NML130574]
MNARSTPLIPTRLLTTGATLGVAVAMTASPDLAHATVTDHQITQTRFTGVWRDTGSHETASWHSVPDFDVGDSTTLTGHGEPGYRVHTTEADGSNPRTVATGLFQVEINGETIPAYCLEISQATLIDSIGTVDRWDDFAKTSPGPEQTRDASTSLRVGWIVQNSYPALELEELAAKVPGVSQLTSDEAIAATQAAIWHYTDEITLEDKTVSASNRSADLGENSVDHVRAVYDYLIEEASGLDLQAHQSTAAAPGSLQVDAEEFLIPADRDPSNPTLLGPVTIDAASGHLALSAESDSGLEYTYTDEDGEPVDLQRVAHGDEIYLAHTADSPDEDTVTWTLEQSHVSQHRFVTLPVHPESHRRSQAILLVTARQHGHEDQVELSFRTETQPAEASSSPAEEPADSETSPEATPQQPPTPAETPPHEPEVSPTQTSEEPVDTESSPATPDVAKPVNAPAEVDDTDRAESDSNNGEHNPQVADDELAKTGSTSSLLWAGVGGAIVLLVGILLVRWRHRDDA